MVEVDNITSPDQRQPISIAADIGRLAKLGVLDALLLDRSTDDNIVWATSSYACRGAGYQPEEEILLSLITGDNAELIRTRASKERSEQAALTKEHAEVFTPTWICNLMINEIDGAWLKELEIEETAAEWKKYVSSRRLEITCGEAPYLVNRYDAATGEPVPVAERIGILDRKLAAITQSVKTRKTWVKWAAEALRSTYGYEFQGDNLLIARVNTLCTVEDFAAQAGYSPLKESEYSEFAEIISWNLWQMDGLNGRVPFGEEAIQFDLNDLLFGDSPLHEETVSKRGSAFVRDWRENVSVKYNELSILAVDYSERGRRMRFDYIVGNPPYQDEAVGENATYTPQIYHQFMDESYKVGRVVELIHPGRFLFDAGSTPKSWNRKMLNDPHFKVLFYEEDSSKVFVNTDIKGGVAISYRDEQSACGPVGVFTKHMELNSVLAKVKQTPEFKSMESVAVSRTAYRFTDEMHASHPEAASQLSDGHSYDVSTNIFERLPQVFFSEKPRDGHDYISILGRTENERVTKFIRRSFINQVENLDSYKLFLPKASGTGRFGEALTQPILGNPSVGATETFMSIGHFKSELEGINASKYMKTKFCRALLGVLKVTQDITPAKWKHVPLQDFTDTSDVDWSQSVSEIDMQLYKKYGLSQEEIDFIETHVKEMD